MEPMSTSQGAPEQTARNPDLLWRVVGGEALLLDTSSGDYFSLDPIGTEIWTRLNDGEAPEHISSLIAQRYAIDEAVARRDVADLISELHAANLWGCDNA
jgi:hypothetical protein